MCILVVCPRYVTWYQGRVPLIFLLWATTVSLCFVLKTMYFWRRVSHKELLWVESFMLIAKTFSQLKLMLYIVILKPHICIATECDFDFRFESNEYTSVVLRPSGNSLFHVSRAIDRLCIILEPQDPVKDVVLGFLIKRNVGFVWFFFFWRRRRRRSQREVITIWNNPQGRLFYSKCQI